jgi:hypothetical protein
VSPTDVLDEARRLGVRISATPDGHLRWRCQGPLPPSLRQQMAAHKTSLLALLQSAIGNKSDGRVNSGGTTDKTDKTREGHESGAVVDFPLTLEDELILEKKLLADKIQTCHGPDLRRRLQSLHEEEPQDLEAALAWHKRLLTLGEAWRSDQARFETLRSAWDPAEADRLLAHLRTELARIKWEKFRGQIPPALANVTADGLVIAEGYIRNHEQEAARGWDALQMLRDLVASLLGTAQRESAGTNQRG